MRIPRRFVVRRPARKSGTGARTRVARDRRGSALLLIMFMTLGLAALAMSAIYLSSNATILSKNFDRERDFRYAAEAALAMGKSRVNNDSLVVPDTGFVAIMSNGSVKAADDSPLTGIGVNLWLGKSGLLNGQSGSYVSVVAEARDARGSRFIRRLELAEENFAKFAYWSDKETNVSGTTIYFNNNDILWGPVWSNDVINIGSGGATFNDEVGTAKSISGYGYGTFKKKVLTNQKPIKLPSNDNLTRLQGYASAGKLNFVAPNGSVSADAMRLRIEFKTVDLNDDGSMDGEAEGFVRVYESKAASPSGISASQWVRGDMSKYNCGDWHRLKNSNGTWQVNGGGAPLWKFYPYAAHVDNDWLEDSLKKNGTMSADAADKHVRTLTLNQVMVHDSKSLKSGQQSGAPTPRCFVGGDPHLVAVERAGLAAGEKGGEDTTFTPNGKWGDWRPWNSAAAPQPVDSRLAALVPGQGNYLFPLFRGLNSGSQGVVHVTGTVGLSGTLRGRVTVYATGSVVLVDDLKYVANSQDGDCADMLGIIASKDIWVADNALNTPQEVGLSKEMNLDDTKDFHLMAVMMALDKAFGVEKYNLGPTDANDCDDVDNGRGCLYLHGGIIQAARGAVGQSSGSAQTGFTKRYSYDRCALKQSPPYFPTTGRYLDNRYYEVDPATFNAGSYFSILQAKLK